MAGRLNFRMLNFRSDFFPAVFSTLNVNLQALAALAMMADRKVSPDNVKSSEKLTLCYQARCWMEWMECMICLDFGTKLIQADFDRFFSTPEGLSCGFHADFMGSRVWVAHKGAFALMDLTHQRAFAGFTIACINTRHSRFDSRSNAFAAAAMWIGGRKGRIGRLQKIRGKCANLEPCRKRGPHLTYHTLPVCQLVLHQIPSLITKFVNSRQFFRPSRWKSWKCRGAQRFSRHWRVVSFGEWGVFRDFFKHIKPARNTVNVKGLFSPSCSGLDEILMRGSMNRAVGVALRFVPIQEICLLPPNLVVQDPGVEISMPGAAEKNTSQILQAD